MASSGKTARLGLCQWVRTDGVCMDDFNADNAKLDEAAAHQPYRRLMDVTAADAVSAIELNLTGLDLSQFARLLIFRRDANYFYIRLNKSAGTYQYYTALSGWQNYGAAVGAEYGCGEIRLGVTGCQLASSYNFFLPPSAAQVTRGTLQTVDLVANAAGTAVFPAGAQFSLWGVRIW